MKKPNGIRVVSDGTCAGTKITTDDGMELHNVQKMSLSFDNRFKVVTATLWHLVGGAEIDLPGEVVDHQIVGVNDCIRCGRKLTPILSVDQDKKYVTYVCGDCEYVMQYRLQNPENFQPNQLDREALSKALEESETHGG